jgi:hypothetical protein
VTSDTIDLSILGRYPGVTERRTWAGRNLFYNPDGPLPARPPAGGVVATGHDFDRLDVIMPHPVYGWRAWICVLNPSQQTWAALRPHLEEGYRLARDRFEHRLRGAPHKR